MKDLKTISAINFMSKSMVKRLTVLILILTLLPLIGFSQKGRKNEPKEKQWKKVTICHNSQTLVINENALQAHLDHGDAIGPCEDSSEFTGTIIPFLESDGKVEEPIGPELTALTESFDTYGNAASDEVFIISENTQVLVEIVTQRNMRQTVLDFLSSTYDITDVIDDGINDLIVTVLFPIDKLAELNLRDDIIRFVTPVYPAITNSGIVTSLGDVAQQSENARNAYGVDGEGITVGVISDSYDVKKQALGNIRNGDLPGLENPQGNLTPVVVLEEYPSESYGSIFSTVDEGRAMLQIVHDVAPKAKLVFRTGVNNAGDMAKGILDLKALEDCDIIVDDVTHYREPFYQDGVIAQAVNTVTADGTTKYLTSAGNFGINSYESQFVPGTENANNHDFNSGSGAEDVMQHVTMGVGFFRIVLQWDDDYYSLPGATNNGAQNDLDIYIIDNAGDTLVNNNTQNLLGDPIEIMTFFVEDTFATSNIVIHRASGTENVNFKYVVYEGNSFQFKEYAAGSSTITGHANAAGAMTVGAVLYSNTPAFDSIPTVASFSSRGGLLVNGSNRSKPDFIAPNGANTTVDLSGFNIDGDIHPNFFGTSASAPHAAGVAALLLQAKSKFGESFDVRQILQQTAVDMGAPGFDNSSGSGLILADAAMLTFAAPKPSITELVIPEGARPGFAPFDLVIKGKNLHNSTKVTLAGAELPAEDIVINSAEELTVAIPVFIGDSSIQASTNAISSTMADGGQSETLYLLRAPKKKILVEANSYTRTYGQRVPEFTATITVDGIALDSTNLTLEDIGLENMTFESPATNLSNIGSDIINTIVAPGEIDSTMLELYDYSFEFGSLLTEKALLKITPNDLTKVYGEKISGITQSFELDTANIDPLDYDTILASIVLGYSSTFVGDNVIAILDRGRGIVNRGRGIVNSGRGIVNRGRGIVNGTGLIITPTTLTNRGRGIVNGNTSIDLQDSLLIDYELDSANALTNRGRGIVNGGPFANGEATTNRGRGIVNDEGDLINRGRGIVNDGALVNSENDTDGFDELIVIVDSTDHAVTGIFSINMISGLEVVPEDSLPHYIVPGGYFALGSENFEITYGLGDLIILPAPLEVVVHDKTIISGDSLPVFASTFNGLVYEEDAAFVFDSINYEPETYSGTGTYEILPTFFFGNEEINYEINSTAGTLSVIEFGTNGRIAFARYNDNFNLEIGVTNSDGTVPVSVVTGSESVRDPQWSPDGTQLAFTLSPRDVRYAESIWKINVDGSGLTELTTDTLNQSPSYSYDGRKIGYIKNNEIAIMNSDGTGQAILTTSNTNKRWTAFSPDGQEIIYIQSEEDVYNGRTNSIWKVNINTLVNEQVSPVEDSLFHRSPVYLKDGSKIIYVRQDRLGQTPRAIMSMNTDGTGQTPILSSQYITNDVGVSPDNTKLTFSLLDSLTGNEYVLYSMNLDGSNIQELYREPNILWWPSWGTNPDQLGADLSISAVSIERQKIIYEEDPWTYVDFTVANSGTEPATGPIVADIYNLTYNGNTISRPETIIVLDSGVVLMPGETVSRRFPVGHLNDWYTGTYSLQVRVDSNDDLIEVAETNNLSAIVNFEVVTVRYAVATNNGLKLMDEAGNVESFISSNSKNVEVSQDFVYSLDVINNQWTIEVYNIQGEFLRSFELPIEVAQNILTTQYLKLVALPNNNFALLDNRGDKIFFIDSQGNYITTVDMLNPSTNLQSADGVVVGNSLVVSENGNSQLLSIDLQTYQISTFWDLSHLSGWIGAIDYNNGTYYVCQSTNIYAFNEGGGTETLIAALPEGNITSIVVNGNYAYVTINFTDRVYKVDISNGSSAILAEGLEYAQDIEIILAPLPALLSVNIPDQNFEQALIDLGFDSDGVVNQQMLRSDAEAITELFIADPPNNPNLPNVSGQISDLTGVEAFTNLTILKCENNLVASLDLTNITGLVDLDFSNNQLSTIDLSQNLSLAYLSGNNNLLTALDLTQNALLTNVSVQQNQIPELDLSQNIELRGLNIEDNQLSTLNLAQNSFLEDLNVAHNLLDTLELNANTQLVNLQVGSNQLTSLDLSANSAITGLFCDFNMLPVLDVSSNTAIINLSCVGNQLAGLNLSQNTSLEFINTAYNPIVALDVSQNTALKVLSASSNQLTSLDVSLNPALTELIVDDNLLANLDVRNASNENLITFNASFNNLSCISVDDETANYLGNWTVDLNVNFSNNCAAESAFGFTDIWSINSVLIAYDIENYLALEQSGYTGNQTIGGGRHLAVSEIGDYAWVSELGPPYQLTKVSDQGVELTTADLSKRFSGVDLVSNERLYALESTGSIGGGKVYILHQSGTYLDSALYGGLDIVVDEANDAVWIIGDDIDKLDMDLNLQFTIDPFTWSATSVDVDISGNAWIGEGRHPSVPESYEQLMKVSPTGVVLDTIPTLTGRPTAVRVNKVDGKVWYVNGVSIIYYDPFDQSHVNVGNGGFTFDIDYHNGVIWTYSSGELLKYSFNGDLISTVSNANLSGQQYLGARLFSGDYNQVVPEELASGSILTQGEVSIYPNPVVDIMKIEHADANVTDTEIQWSVLNALGFPEPVSGSWNAQDGVMEVFMNSLQPGYYFVHVTAKGVTNIFRVQKN